MGFSFADTWICNDIFELVYSSPFKDASDLNNNPLSFQCPFVNIQVIPFLALIGYFKALRKLRFPVLGKYDRFVDFCP